MVYSCGLWEGPLDDELEKAQLAKLAWHVSAARANGAGRVLDVGCGWGAMLGDLTSTCGDVRCGPRHGTDAQRRPGVGGGHLVTLVGGGAP